MSSEWQEQVYLISCSDVWYKWMIFVTFWQFYKENRGFLVNIERKTAYRSEANQEAVHRRTEDVCGILAKIAVKKHNV